MDPIPRAIGMRGSVLSSCEVDESSTALLSSSGVTVVDGAGAMGAPRGMGDMLLRLISSPFMVMGVSSRGERGRGGRVRGLGIIGSTGVLREAAGPPRPSGIGVARSIRFSRGGPF